jgi:hypothetical protein
MHPQSAGIEAIREKQAAMVRAAGDYLTSLTPSERDQTLHPYASEFRTRWNALPLGCGERLGTPWPNLTPDQQASALNFLATGLSQRGLETVRTIVEIERIHHPEHGTKSYSISIYGEPTVAGPWAWRFEGHHLSLNFSSIPNVGVGATPAFWGASPTCVRFNLGTPIPVGTHVLVCEDELARTIYSSLSSQDHALAEIPLPEMELRTAQTRYARPNTFRGVPVISLGAEKQVLIQNLVSTFAENFCPELSSGLIFSLLPSRADDLFFGCAKGADGNARRSARPDGFYFRIEGPEFFLEYDDVQFGIQGTGHVHALLRHFKNDFGGDTRYAPAP